MDQRLHDSGMAAAREAERRWEMSGDERPSADGAFVAAYRAGVRDAADLDAEDERSDARRRADGADRRGDTVEADAAEAEGERRADSAREAGRRHLADVRDDQIITAR